MVAPRARSPRAFLAEAKISEVQRAACPELDPGGAGRRGPALNFRRRHTRRPARRFLTEDSVLVGGRVSGAGPRPARAFGPRRSDAPVLSRSASSLFGGPAVVRGGRIRRPSPKIRRERTESASVVRAAGAASPPPSGSGARRLPRWRGVIRLKA